jgi:hypothetical protein
MSKSRETLKFLLEDEDAPAAPAMMPPKAPPALPVAQNDAPPPPAVDGGEDRASHTGDEYEKYFEQMHDLAQKLVVLGNQIKLFAAKQEMESSAVLADINAVLEESDPKMKVDFLS